MRSLSTRIIALVGSPAGVLVLAALDSTVFFSLPGGIDAAIVMLSARRQSFPWMVFLLALSGSMAGAALTFWMGVKIGVHGLDRYIAARRLARLRRKVHRGGAIGLAALDLIPPPFPFTPCILAAGALETDAATFFGALTVGRAIRFGGEALLAVIYGRRILAWLDSDGFRDVVIGCTILGLVLTIASLAKALKSVRPGRRRAASG